MNWTCEIECDKPLRPAESEEAYKLHLAALEWSLIDPIIINSISDLKSTNWKDRGLEPFKHQVKNLMTFCRRLPVTLIADDVGLGKTISAGLILSELIARRRVNRALVLCPKVLTSQWVVELERHFGLEARDVSGAEFDRELKKTSGIVVTTYETARGRLDKIESGMFDMCIMDEAHKLRNLYGSQNTPVLPLKIKEALGRRPFKYVVMMTATPIQNKIVDLYSLLDLLKTAEGKPNPLGNYGDFTTKFLEPNTGGRSLRKSATIRFQQIFRENLIKNRRVDCDLSFPIRETRMQEIELTKEELKLKDILGEYLEGMSIFAQFSLSQALMSSPKALLSQIENMVRNKTLHETVLLKINEIANSIIIPSKLKYLNALISELQKSRPIDWRIVVFTTRRETLEMIGDYLRKNNISVGYIQGGSAKSNNATISLFKDEPPGVHVIVSTDAGAEGINLQSCNILINYDLPWNPMIVEQRIGRIQRLGSHHNSVQILNFAGKDGIENKIVTRLQEKLFGISQALGDIESILESVGIDDEGEGSFESRIGNMVINAIRGKDIEEARAKEERNIDEAKKLYETQKEYLEQTLGNPEKSKSEILTMPEIERKSPSIAYKEFVLRAKQAEGWTIREVNTYRYEATRSGRTAEKISFAETNSENPGLFGGSPALCYLPGQPAFERLVQHWTERSSVHLANLEKSSRSKGIEIAKNWFSTQSFCAIQDCQFESTELHFQGNIITKTRAINGVDRFEKIMTLPCGNNIDIHKIDTHENEFINRDITPTSQINSVKDIVNDIVLKDDEVNQFCSYYEQRLQDGIKEVGENKQLRAKILSDFRPQIQADVVALDGAFIHSGKSIITFIAEDATYNQVLLLNPFSNDSLPILEQDMCAVSKTRLPMACLQKCEVTGSFAVQHLLTTTEIGQKVLPELVSTCSITGKVYLLADMEQCGTTMQLGLRSKMEKCGETQKWALPSEIGVSEYSGRKVLKSLLSTSEKPPFRNGIKSEFRLCEISKKLLLLDELKPSEVSTKYVDKDLLTTCPVTKTLLLPDELKKCEMTGQMVSPLALVTCSKSNVVALKSEMGKCAVTNCWSLQRYLGKSDFSGKVASKEFLLQSGKSNRIGLNDEFVICKLTGVKLLQDEIGRSDYSDLIVDKDLLVKCEVSNKLLLDSELVTCSHTGKRVTPNLIKNCAVSNRSVIHNYLKKCEATGDMVLPENLGKSVYSGKNVRIDLLIPSEKPPYRLGIPQEMVKCRKTGKLLLADETGTSDESGLIVDKDLLVKSNISNKRALKDEMIVCEESDAAILKCESQICDISKKVCDKRLLDRIAQTNKFVLKNLTGHCESTGIKVLYTELALCELTGKRVLKSELVRCELTNKLCCKRWMARSDVSKRYAIPEMTFQSPTSNLTALIDEGILCTWTSKMYIKQEIGQCSLTYELVAKELLNRDQQLIPLVNLLDGLVPDTTKTHKLNKLLENLTKKLHGVQFSEFIRGPANVVAVCSTIVKNGLWGTKTKHAGFLFDLETNRIRGDVILGNREKSEFIIEDSFKVKY